VADEEGLECKWETTVSLGGLLFGEGLRRVGIRRRVENSVGCLSEKRLFIRRGKRVEEEDARDFKPFYS